MLNAVYIEKLNSAIDVRSAILNNIDNRYITRCRSREEQDGANHFAIQPTMDELWPSLCGDAGEKEKEGIFCLF